MVWEPTVVDAVEATEARIAHYELQIIRYQTEIDRDREHLEHLRRLRAQETATSAA